MPSARTRYRRQTAGLFAQFGGYVEVLLYVAKHLRQLANPQLRIMLLAQVSAQGIEALPLIAPVAALGGSIVIIGLASLLGADNDLAISAGLFFLWLEFAPLLAALVLIARTSGSMAGELALMRLHDELTALEYLHIPYRDFVFLPRVVGAALGALAATVWVQLLSLAVGMTAAAMVIGFRFVDQLRRTLDIAPYWLLYAGMAKAVCFGLILAAIACHQGISVRRSSTEISRAGLSAITQGMVYVFLFDAVLALATYFAWAAPK